MLEKSRVVQRGDGDKNFHIFYYFLADLPEDKRKAFSLSDPEHYRYVMIYMPDSEHYRYVMIIYLGSRKLYVRYDYLCQIQNITGTLWLSMSDPEHYRCILTHDLFPVVVKHDGCHVGQEMLTLSGTPYFAPFGVFMILPIHYMHYRTCQS